LWILAGAGAAFTLNVSQPPVANGGRTLPWRLDQHALPPSFHDGIDAPSTPEPEGLTDYPKCRETPAGPKGPVFALRRITLS
jgi:hypothetical protein